MAGALDLSQFEEVPAASGGRALDLSQFEEVPAASKPGKLESFGRGALQGVTFGFADELTGALESLFTDKTYSQSRDESRANYRAAKEANPGTYLAGELGGGLATMAIPGGAIARGAGAAAKAGGFAANAVRGAGAGILSGIGQSEAEDLEGIAKDAAVSGLVGGAVGGVAGTVGEKLLGGAKGRVDTRLMSDIGDRAKKVTRDKLAEFAPQVRETARKFGLDKVAREAPELAKESNVVRKAIGQRIGETYEAVDKHFMGADIDDVVQALRNVKVRYNTPADATVRKAIDSEIATVRDLWGKKGRVGLEKLNKYIGKLEDKGFSKADLTPSAGTQLRRDMAGQLENVLQKRFGEIQESAANFAAAPSIAARPAFAQAGDAAAALRALPKLNEQYRALKLIEQAGKWRSREQPFKPVGLRSFTLRGLGEKAWEATGGKLARPADELMAKLSAAAERGDAGARAALMALQRGVPRTAAANAEDIPGVALSAVATPLLPDDSPY